MQLETTKPLVSSRWLSILTLIGFVMVCALNIWVFRHFLDRNYLEWYSAAGPLIALATAAFGAAWGGLDKNPALVSANPLGYLGACLQVAGLPLITVGSHMRSKNQETSNALEFVPLFFLAICLTSAILGWLLLIVPVQYFLFLVSGSLPRISLASSAQVSARITHGRIELSEIGGKGLAEPEAGWWDASMRNKPVTLASAYGAVLLFFLNALL
jgi:hypothetical protein